MALTASVRENGEETRCRRCKTEISGEDCYVVIERSTHPWRGFFCSIACIDSHLEEFHPDWEVRGERSIRVHGSASVHRVKIRNRKYFGTFLEESSQLELFPNLP